MSSHSSSASSCFAISNVNIPRNSGVMTDPLESVNCEVALPRGQSFSIASTLRIIEAAQESERFVFIRIKKTESSIEGRVQFYRVGFQAAFRLTSKKGVLLYWPAAYTGGTLRTPFWSIPHHV